MRRASGFTLIEMMIVVVVLGILAKIAIPMYMESVRRGQITEATNALSALKVYQEQFYQDNRAYGAAGGTACGALVGAVANAQVPNTKHFTISCVTNNGNQGFVGTATGSGGMTTGFSYTIDQQGNQTTGCASCAWGTLTVAQTQTWTTSKP